MNSQQLTRWIIGTMLAVILTLLSFIMASTNSRFNRIEAKVDFVVEQYGKIDVLEERMMGLQRALDLLQSQIVDR